MGVFDDKKFEELDWISQATEPIDSQLNEVLGLIPDEIVIDFETYKRMVGDNYSLDLNIDRMISFAIKEFTKKHLTWEQKDALKPCFQIQMDETVYLNFETQQVDGTIKLIKIQSTMDEKVLKNLLGNEGILAVGQMYIPQAGMSRANEIMEILAKCDDGLRTRSPNKKRHILKNRLTQLFKDNEWNIRDTELANKVGRWIKEYIVDGNLAALSNFCRLKVMTHKGQPIYSMEETQ